VCNPCAHRAFRLFSIDVYPFLPATVHLFLHVYVCLSFSPVSLPVHPYSLSVCLSLLSLSVCLSLLSLSVCLSLLSLSVCLSLLSLSVFPSHLCLYYLFISLTFPSSICLSFPLCLYLSFSSDAFCLLFPLICLSFTSCLCLSVLPSRFSHL
jgi:hypothetical protein